jgi:hypothetical protein
MDTIIQSIFRFAAVASPGETIRLLATVSTLMGQQLLNLPSSMGNPSWRIINITSKFGTIVFKVNWLLFRFLLLTFSVDHHAVVRFPKSSSKFLSKCFSRHESLDCFEDLTVRFCSLHCVILLSWDSLQQQLHTHQ